MTSQITTVKTPSRARGRYTISHIHKVIPWNLWISIDSSPLAPSLCPLSLSVLRPLGPLAQIALSLSALSLPSRSHSIRHLYPLNRARAPSPQSVVRRRVHAVWPPSTHPPPVSAAHRPIRYPLVRVGTASHTHYGISGIHRCARTPSAYGVCTGNPGGRRIPSHPPSSRRHRCTAPSLLRSVRHLYPLNRARAPSYRVYMALCRCAQQGAPLHTMIHPVCLYAPAVPAGHKGITAYIHIACL